VVVPMRLFSPRPARLSHTFKNALHGRFAYDREETRLVVYRLTYNDDVAAARRVGLKMGRRRSRDRGIGYVSISDMRPPRALPAADF
jgi:hypothetical protein